MIEKQTDRKQIMYSTHNYTELAYRVFGDNSTDIRDVIGDRDSSRLFPFMVKYFGFLLDVEKCHLSEGQIRFHRTISRIIKTIGPLFLQNKQVLENRNRLRGVSDPEESINLPTTPVIWSANHSFKDDILASMLVIRHSHILIGSLPAIYNTVDGILAYLNGIILTNRKLQKSKSDAVKLITERIQNGLDVLMFPEGVWNKTPDRLLIDFWPGIYRVSVETGCPIVPVIHYIRDPHNKSRNNKIHTVVDDPIDMSQYSEKQGLRYLRDVMATWYCLMMERYGQSTRAEVLDGYDTADDAWHDYLEMHTGAVPYYDLSIETIADYRPKQIVRPADVFRPICFLKNSNPAVIKSILWAQAIVEREKNRDFQRRF